MFESKCDDGNKVSGDGCSDKCELEKWFKCNVLKKPTFCKSSITVVYEIDRIEKDEGC